MGNTVQVSDEMQDFSPGWRTVVRVGPAIIVAVFYVAVVLHYNYTPDDTYIYLQYAKNLANGYGFSFNAGTPSYGITGPLWALLIASGVKAGLDPFVVAKTFDLLFASLSIVLVYILSVVIIRDKVLALFASILLASDAWFLRWSGTGMETSFAVILVLLTLRYAYTGDYHIAGFVSGLLTLVRPEGFLLFLVIQLENFIMAFVLGRNRHLFWAAAGLYLLVVVPWTAFSLTHFGTIVPNTEIAKSAVHWSFRDVAGTLYDSLAIIFSTQPLSVVLLVVGVPFVIRKGGIGTFIAKAMPLLWVPGMIFGYALLNVQVVSRYLVPVIPVVIVYALWCLKQMEHAFQWNFKKTTALAGALAVATVIQSQLIYDLRVVPHMSEFSFGMEHGIRPIALWLRSNSDPNASVLTPDVGMIGYVSDRRVFDTAGLITPAVKRAFGTAGYDEGMKGRLYATVVTPDYIVDRADVDSRFASDSLRPIMTTQFTGLGMKKSERVYYTLYKVVQ